MGTDTTEYYRCSCGQDVVESEQLAHESWCADQPTGLKWQGADCAPPDLQEPAGLKWRRNSSGNYYAEDRSLGTSFLVGKTGPRRWFIEAWPSALPGAAQYVRSEYGIATMASARAMALDTKCFRCGRGRPLILMERYSPRWRCRDQIGCEAERARLLAARPTTKQLLTGS